jgi:hypothetical protein
MKALQNASSDQTLPIFYPRVGTDFSSCEGANDFYNLYSWEKGFGIRYGRSRNNYRLGQDIVCSCEVILKFLSCEKLEEFACNFRYSSLR